MIELDFQQFHDQQYREQRYELYILKNGLGEILYIGISKNNIWQRWFGWGGHMMWDGKVIYGESPVGVKIENHLPDSLNWKIQLWTLQDCVKFCRNELPSDILEITIDEIEPIIIRKLSPALNSTFNLNPGKDNTPKSQKEMELERKADELYREIFNNKK
jgi:hypothetical protein